MKKYFTKYIPVEGSVKSFDTFLLDSKEYYCLGTDDKMIWYDNGLQTELVSANPESCTKLKLFLCSRDIQVGDTVALIDDYRTTGSVESIDDCEDLHIVWSDCSTSCEHPKNVVKVIGAISPEATWVTEGMEFEEDEIFRCFVHENVSKLSDPMKREVQIKGPCGHFH